MTPITAALRELAAKATPGPWQAYIAYSGESGTPDEVGIYAGAGTTHHGQENTVISDWTLYGSEMLPDLEYIAALSPSTLNLLLDVVERRTCRGRPARNEMPPSVQPYPPWRPTMPSDPQAVLARHPADQCPFPSRKPHWPRCPR